MQLGLSFKERRGGGGHLRASEISGIIPTYARQTQNKTAGRQTHNVGSNAKVSPDSPGAINPSQKSPTGLCDLSRCCARACTPRPYTQTPYTVFFFFFFFSSFFFSVESSISQTLRGRLIQSYDRFVRSSLPPCPGGQSQTVPHKSLVSTGRH